MFHKEDGKWELDLVIGCFWLFTHKGSFNLYRKVRDPEYLGICWSPVVCWGNDYDF